MDRQYHKYIFDREKRKFVGRFEEMYQAEETEGYDSWFQEDLRALQKQVSLAVLGRYNFGRILDLGCGKGTFTHLLKKTNNYVVGIDGSKTAIARARAKYTDIDFRVADAGDVAMLDEVFDLVVAMELLSYIEHWRHLLAEVAGKTNYLYLTLYVPHDPIGFVASLDDLRDEIRRHFVIETELVQDGEHIYIFASSLTRWNQ